MKTLIIDSSIFLGWIFPDENDIYSTTIHNDFLHRRIDLVAPSILLYEVLNAIRSAILRRRIDKTIGNALVNESLHALPQLVDFSSFAKDAYQLSNEYDISIYDASYVVLSQKEKLPFYTGDKKLADKLKNLKSVFWVGKYQ